MPTGIGMRLIGIGLLRLRIGWYVGPNKSTHKVQDFTWFSVSACRLFGIKQFTIDSEIENAF